MADALEANTNLIGSEDEIVKIFLQGNRECQIGIELEFSVLKQNPDGSFSGIDNRENKELQKILKNPGAYGYDRQALDVSEEAGTFTLEIKTGAVAPAKIEDILLELDRKIAIFASACEKKGYKINPFAQIPGLRSSDADIIDRPRARIFIDTFRCHALEGYCRNFFLNTSVQTSVSYRDANHLYASVFRLLLLTAPLSVAHDNGCGFLEGQPDPQLTGLRLREGLKEGDRGGVPSFFFEAKDGEDFIQRYIRWALGTKLLCLYNAEGKNLHIVPTDDERSFSNLIESADGLNHSTNLDLALGMVWPHVKIGFIKNGGAVSGVRFEARACDMGAWQYATFPLIVTALAFDEDFASAVDGLLSDYGFGMQDRAASKTLYDASIDAALHLRDSFGTGSLTGFLSTFGRLVEQAYANEPTLLARLQPFLNICKAGQIPGQTIREHFNDLAAVDAAIREKGDQYDQTKQSRAIPDRTHRL